MSDTASDTNTDTQAPAPPPRRLSFTAEEAIARYVKLRDKVDLIEKEQKQALLPYKAAMETLEGHLMAIMNDNKLENIKTSAGTAYTTTHTSATVKDWSKTLAFIMEHDMTELLEARVNKTVVLETLKTTGEVIPGVAVTQRNVIQIRRASGG